MPRKRSGDAAQNDLNAERGPVLAFRATFTGAVLLAWGLARVKPGGAYRRH